ncbi:MAG: hypothetical protein M3280_11245 [Actinomycetota bacterium]|nr:hypothetical protein [Actinomycetota bacterium]
MDARPRRPTALLGEASRGDAHWEKALSLGPDERETSLAPDEQATGDLVVLFLASALAGLCDQLARDKLFDAADLVAELVEIAEDYIIGPHNN